MGSFQGQLVARQTRVIQGPVRGPYLTDCAPFEGIKGLSDCSEWETGS